MKIAVGADHAGFALKEHMRDLLTEQGHEVTDCGPCDADSVDYPDFAHIVAGAVAEGDVDRGLLVCGTGLGMSMAANRHEGVRAAVCSSIFETKMSRLHNDANVLCIGARVIGEGLAEELLRIFLETEFEEGRHQRRVDKIDDIAPP